MAETEKLDDNEFEIYLVKEFLRRGYVLVKRDKEVINQKEYYKDKDITVENIMVKK